jgi:hypothetical protein
VTKAVNGQAGGYKFATGLTDPPWMKRATLMRQIRILRQFLFSRVHRFMIQGIELADMSDETNEAWALKLRDNRRVDDFPRWKEHDS